MKFTAPQKTLSAALGRVNSVIESKNTIPIIGNVLLTIQGGDLRLRGTNLDMEMSERIDVAVAREGALTVPAKVLSDYVRKLPEGDIAFEEVEGRLKVSLKRSSVKLGLLPADDFPDIGGVEGGVRYSIPAADLRTLFDRAAFAISKEETRYYLNGIYLHHIDGRLRAVSTDGHRLAQVDIECPAGAATSPAVIVPTKMVAETLRLLDKVESAVEIEVSAKKIRLIAGDVSLTSKLIDGSFPDYARVIPSSHKATATVDTKDLLSALGRVATLANDKGIKFTFNEGTLRLNGTDKERGETAVEEIDTEFTGGTEFETGYNSSYVLAIASQIEGKSLCFELVDPSGPAKIVDPEDASTLYVQMPMRV